MKYAPIIAAIWLTLAMPARGDTLFRSDGTRLEGFVVAEEKDTILFESHYQGITLRQHIARDQVKGIVKDESKGPGYYPLSLEGTVGEDITAESLATALDMARREKAEYVILVINSRGGKISEMTKIAELLTRTQDLKLIAHVERANSAAAIIAMGCRTITMGRGGSIGAAVPIYVSPQGTVGAVEAKFESAFRAACEAIAESGRHSRLLVRGMMEMDLELTVRSPGERPQIVDGPPTRPGDVLLKRKGTILTLTAREAVNVGLAAAVLDSPDAVQAVLGLKEWHKVSDNGWFYLRNRAAAAREFAVRNAAKTEAAGSGLQSDPTDTAATLQKKIAAAEDYKRKLQAAITELPVRDVNEAYGIEVAYEHALLAAHPPGEAEYYRKKADDHRTAQLGELKKLQQTRAADLKGRLEDVSTALAALQASKRQLAEAAGK